MPDQASDQERWLTVIKLGEAGQTAVPALLEALKHKDAVVRYWAAAGLGLAGAKEAAPALAAAAKDESGDVRVAAAEALARLGKTEEAAAAFVAVLGDPSEWVRLRALQTIERLGPAAGDALPAARKAAKADKGYPGRMAEHFADETKAPKKGRQ